MGNQKPQFEPLNMHIFFFIHPKFKNAKLEEKKKQTQHNKHNNKHNNPAMADSCDQFEPNKWRPTVCAKCFAKESLHVKAGGGGGRGGGGGASSGGPPPRKHRPQYAATSSQQPTTPPPRSEPQQQQTPPTPPPKVSPKSSSSRGSSSNKSSPGHRRTGSRGAVPTTPLPSTPPVANQPTTPPKITSSSYPKSESKKKSTRPASSCVEPTMSLSSKERKKKGGSRIETSGDDLQIDLGGFFLFFFCFFFVFFFALASPFLLPNFIWLGILGKKPKTIWFLHQAKNNIITSFPSLVTSLGQSIPLSVSKRSENLSICLPLVI